MLVPSADQLFFDNTGLRWFLSIDGNFDHAREDTVAQAPQFSEGRRDAARRILRSWGARLGTYSEGCTWGKPLSEAACTSTTSVTSNIVVVAQ
jgi:hypothetical protein